MKRRWILCGPVWNPAGIGVYEDMILTMWGDDGAYCDYWSVQSGVFLAGN